MRLEKGMQYINDPSQVMRTVQLNPRIVINPKFRLSTGFLPKRARVASSREDGPEAEAMYDWLGTPSFIGIFSVIASVDMVAEAKG